MSRRSWNDTKLAIAVKSSTSVRQVLNKLGLKEAGGNYSIVQRHIKLLALDTSHFSGKGWRKGRTIPTIPAIPLNKLFTKNSTFQSHKLKRRLFREGIKNQACEECGWCKLSADGRLPLELDHINGDRTDNRLSNLRVLCPNCHSLKPTHRGRNKGRGGVIGSHERLKIS